MAIGRQSGLVSTIIRAPRRGPQSSTRGLLAADVLAWTRGERAAALSVIPKRTHTYFGPYKPGTAQRIPPVINTGYGRDYASNSERIRTALVARAQMFSSALRLASPPADQVSSAQAVRGVDAATAQASLVGQA